MAKVTDPVCGMEVDTGGKHHTEYKGESYHFCCPACLNKFNEDPEKYIHQETAGNHCGNHDGEKKHEGCCGKHHH